MGKMIRKKIKTKTRSLTNCQTHSAQKGFEEDDVEGTSEYELLVESSFSGGEEQSEEETLLPSVQLACD